MIRLSVSGMVLAALCCGCEAQPSAPGGSAATSNNTPTPVAPAVSNASGGVQPGPTDEDAPAEFTATSSGLKYKILRKSDGKKPTAANTVLAHYKGWLDNGKEFDSSYQCGEPAEFPLGAVIPGWTEGLQLIGEGGMIELEIPSELGYGERGAGADIPPNATLHFLVELIAVK